MARPKTKRKCVTCQSRAVVKNGTNSAGRTRYRCKACGASSTGQEPALRRRKRQLTEHVDYWTSPASKTTPIKGPRSTWDRRHAWCWDYHPTPPLSGEVHDQVIIDGKYLPYGWCVLIATNGTHVINWQFCHRETTQAYQALLAPIPPPSVVVTDGASGALKAINTLWPHTLIQRCLFHLHQNTITNTTRHPRTPSHKAICALSRQLLAINNPDQATGWLENLTRFYNHYKPTLFERTYKNDTPQNQWPKHVRPTQKWWYTHKNLCQAYFRFEKLNRKQHLFTYLTPGIKCAKTTSSIESVNATLQELLHRHRGLSAPHMLNMIAWKLYQATPEPKPPAKLLETMTPHPIIKPAKPLKPDPIYGKEIDQLKHYEDPGISIRKGYPN